MKRIILIVCMLASMVAAAQTCPPVTSPVASSIGPTSARTSWTAAAGSIIYQYSLYRMPSRTFVVSGSGTATFKDWVGLSPVTTYRAVITNICISGTPTNASAPDSVSFTTLSDGINYTPLGNTKVPYFKIDSNLLILCGDTTRGRAPNVMGQLKMRCADSLFYYYDGHRWKTLSIDSVGIVSQLNNKVDSVTVVGQLLFYWKQGVGYGYTLPAGGDSVYFQNGGPPGFNLLRQKNDSVFVFKSIVLPYGDTGDSTTTDSVLVIIRDTSIIATVLQVQHRIDSLAATVTAALIVNSTPITSGTDTRVLFQDGSVLGEDAGLVYNKTSDLLTVGSLTSTNDALINGQTFGTGNNALTSSKNTAAGYLALGSRTTGSINSAFGWKALNANTTGDGNTAFGSEAGENNTTGVHNTYTGYAAGYSNIDGIDNTATGYLALFLCTTNGKNTATGMEALRNTTTGFSNTADGYQALLSNTTGQWNTITGAAGGSLNTTGSQNTGAGHNVLYSNTTGDNNVAIGDSALGNNTTGSGNIGIGKNAKNALATTSNKLIIGNGGIIGADLSTGQVSFSGSGYGTTGQVLTANTGAAPSWSSTIAATTVPLSGITTSLGNNSVNAGGYNFGMTNINSSTYTTSGTVKYSSSFVDANGGTIRAYSNSGLNAAEIIYTNYTPSLTGITSTKVVGVSVVSSGGNRWYNLLDSNAQKIVADTVKVTATVGVGINKTPTSALDVTGTTKSTQFAATYQTLTDASTITWNANSGSNATVTIAATGRTLSITNPVQGAYYTVKIIQDGAGSKTITTWPTNTKWPGGVAPTLTTTAAAVDIICFFYDGTNYYANYNYDFK